jgi:hypothetical protein
MNDVLQSALEALGNAHGVAALRAAFRSVQRRVRSLRRDGEADTLGAVVMEALDYRDKLKADGVEQEDLDAGLEALLRERWPKPHDRTTPWKYLCEACGDTGLRMLMCRPGMRCPDVSTRTDGPGDKPGKYQRLCVGSSSYTHDYGVPCDCAKGDRFRTRQRPALDDFTTATKSKPRSMSRFGR